MSDHSKPDEGVQCAECGRFGAVEFGETRVCPACAQVKGSCCSEGEE